MLTSSKIRVSWYPYQNQFNSCSHPDILDLCLCSCFSLCMYFCSFQSRHHCYLSQGGSDALSSCSTSCIALRVLDHLYLYLSIYNILSTRLRTSFRLGSWSCNSRVPLQARLPQWRGSTLLSSYVRACPSSPSCVLIDESTDVENSSSSGVPAVGFGRHLHISASELPWPWYPLIRHAFVGICISWVCTTREMQAGDLKVCWSPGTSSLGLSVV